MSQHRCTRLQSQHSRTVFRRGAAILLLAMSLPACTSTMVLSGNSPTADDRVNRRLADRDATLRLTSGGIFAVYHFQVASDSVRYISPLGPVAIPREDFISVEVRDGGRGALEGVLLGGAIGGVLGVAAEMYGGFDERNSYQECSGGSCIAGGLLGGAIWGGVIGLIRKARLKVVRPVGN